jgi:hypothetical protein
MRGRISIGEAAVEASMRERNERMEHRMQLDRPLLALVKHDAANVLTRIVRGERGMLDMVRRDPITARMVMRVLDQMADERGTP